MPRGAWSHLLRTPARAEFSPRPPGAKPDPHFAATCIKCGQCVEACPFDTLKLATANDPEPIGTPYFKPRDIPCYMCEDIPCAKSCPTDALGKLENIDDADMGLAVLIDQENCLAYRGLRCEVCYRACPLIDKAIHLEYRPQKRTGKHAFFLPIVHSEACTGCGKCEHTCVMEKPAIKILPRHLAQGKLQESYRFDWLGTPSFPESTTSPVPTPETNMEHVLQTMGDLSGIEEP